MYDELVERLRESKNEQCYIGCFGICDDCKIDADLKQAADAIEELMRRCEQFQYMPLPAWIPVTERLPEPYSGEYLVTINDGSVYTDILWFDSPGDGRYESCFYKTDDDGYGVVCDDVIAWMPLPQPYKGERKDND